MINKEKLISLAEKDNSNILQDNNSKIKNREMLKASQWIALKVLERLDELNWTKKELGKKMSVSPQHISKIVSGKENLTLETIVRLQKILDISILNSYSNQDLFSDEIFSAHNSHNISLVATEQFPITEVNE